MMARYPILVHTDRSRWCGRRGSRLAGRRDALLVGFAKDEVATRFAGRKVELVQDVGGPADQAENDEVGKDPASRQ